jgi:hypothetical protein
MQPAVDDLQHRKAAMALSEKAPKLVALVAQFQVSNESAGPPSLRAPEWT